MKTVASSRTPPISFGVPHVSQQAVYSSRPDLWRSQPVFISCPSDPNLYPTIISSLILCLCPYSPVLCLCSPIPCPCSRVPGSQHLFPLVFILTEHSSRPTNSKVPSIRQDSLREQPGSLPVPLCSNPKVDFSDLLLLSPNSLGLFSFQFRFYSRPELIRFS